MSLLFSNFFDTTLLNAITNTDLSLTVKTGKGALLNSPTGGDYELLTLISGESYEIVKVTARSGDVCTIVRAQEGTTALPWPAKTQIRATVTKGILDKFPQLDNGGNAKGSNALNLQTGRLDAANVASGTGAIDIGYDGIASGSYAIATSKAKATGTQAVAIGRYSEATADYAIAMLQGFARAAWSLAIYVTNRVERSIMTNKHFVAKMDDGDDGQEHRTSAPPEIMWTPPMDIGVPPTWATATIYNHGDIVQPTVSNTYQYRLVCPDDAVTLTIKTTHTTTTEPTWPTVAGDSVANADGSYWVFQKPSATYLMGSPPTGTLFIPQQFGFLCEKYTALTGTPTCSYGLGTNHTKYTSSTSITITAANKVSYVWPSVATCCPDTDNIAFTLTAAASAGSCQGRFWVMGYFVELQVHA